MFPVITLLMGASAAFARDAFTQSRQDRRELTARQHERDTALENRREEFELQHLVEVHDLLRANMDAFERWAYLTRRQADADPEVMEELAAARRDVGAAENALRAQIGFVLSDDVRAYVDRAASQISALGTMAPGLRSSENFDELVRIGKQVRDAYEVIAARVREIYAGRMT